MECDMKFIIAAILTLLLFSPSFADSLTITLTSTTGTCTAGCTKTFSDTSSATPNTLQSNIITVYQSVCNVSINGTCTAAQVLTFWAGTIKSAFVATVTAYQLQQLQNAAIAGYIPINPQ
jgi:hypothetical protein